MPKQAIPKILSLRDAFAFKEHVESSAEEAGRSVVEQYYQYPSFYYANHLNVTGPGPVEVYPLHLEKLDFELEVVIFIGKEGKDISRENADEHILGFSIMNDFSARHIQWDEMKVKLGPHKGKDFATSIGPDLVPTAELASFKRTGRNGGHWDLKMEAFLKNELISQGNLGDMHFTFAQIIERASTATTLFPGECIGSGTVGSGCLREYNFSMRKKNPKHEDRWLKPGDEIELRVEGLGSLKNTIVLKDS